MKIYENKKVVVKNVATGVQCDCCEKKYSLADFKDQGISVTAFHAEWEDTLERFDLCSGACYVKQLVETVEDFKGYATATVFEMPIAMAEVVVAMLGGHNNVMVNVQWDEMKAVPKSEYFKFSKDRRIAEIVNTCPLHPQKRDILMTKCVHNRETMTNTGTVEERDIDRWSWVLGTKIVVVR